MRGVSNIMKYQLTTAKNTFIICCLTCLAYEATRINGWYNRYSVSDGYSGIGFYEIAVIRWESEGPIVYAAIFSCFVVVACNKLNPQIQFSWFWFSVFALISVCACIPNAMVDRIPTHQVIGLFYMLIVPLPALAFIAVGFYTNIANKRMQSDAAEPRR